VAVTGRRSAIRYEIRLSCRISFSVSFATSLTLDRDLGRDGQPTLSRRELSALFAELQAD
jgi:hypothetical protein